VAVVENLSNLAPIKVEAIADADMRNALNHPGRRKTAETAIDGWT
jgi:hypothetical protein